MRIATLTLAMLGLLWLGTTRAVAQEQPANAPPAPDLTAAVDQAAVTPIRWYGYVPAPGWRAYRYPYYAYRPRYYSYGPRRYYDYNYGPYPEYQYYYPDNFGFSYYGPRTSFSFGY